MRRTVVWQVHFALEHEPEWHLMPQPPQLLASERVLNSQPSAALPLQSEKPALHAPRPQVLVSQTPTAFGGLGHTVLHEPQCMMSAVVSVSQPSATFMLQSAWLRPHIPMVHIELTQALAPNATAGQTLPHMPQWARSVVRLVSQPSVAPPKQSSKPALQVSMPQAKPEHLGVPLAIAGHTLVQAPQFIWSAERSTSQPLATRPSQSAKPASQPPMAQVEFSHLGYACGSTPQGWPQAPQWFTSVAGKVSQPSKVDESQSA
jgi:hypothetical protein